MKRRIVWLVVSGLMALSLVLASCGEAVTEEEVVTEEEEVVTEEEVTEEEEVAAKEEVAPAVEEPQYGGTFTHAEATDPQYWDYLTVTGPSVYSRFMALATDTMTVWNRTKGPGGTGEWWNGLGKWFQSPDQLVGQLAESWEIIQPDTIIFHLRQGVHFQNKAPAYGAEMTADDVVWSYVRLWAVPGTNRHITQCYLAIGKNSDDYTWENVSKCIYIDPDDPWAVVVKTIPGEMAFIWENTAGTALVVPKAGYESIGGKTKNISSWKYLCGTGPYILTDYIAGSSMTYERNPDYFKKDQLHPENQLPYIDTYKELIMPDQSSRLAALRTGKLDHEWMLEWDDAKSLWKSNPELKSVDYFENLNVMEMAHDKAPFDNMNVRRAMMMAIDYETIVQDIYEGHGLYYFCPFTPIPEHAGYYPPLDELGLSSDGFDIQKLFTYHPDDAEKLLDAAGLPRGKDGVRFTTSCTCYAEADVDMLSIIKEYWADVGVTLNIDIKDSAVFKAMQLATLASTQTGGTVTFPNGCVHSLSVDLPKFTFFAKNGSSNYAHVFDPTVQEALEACTTYYFDRPKREQIVRGLMPEIVSHANLIPMPNPYSYIFWQPWVKGFNGERMACYGDALTVPVDYMWIDQDLKEEMTGRR